MTDKFAEGTVVCLKSGGPRMTLVKYGDYTVGRKAMCKWFDSKGQVQMDTFFDAELEAEE